MDPLGAVYSSLTPYCRVRPAAVLVSVPLPVAVQEDRRGRSTLAGQVDCLSSRGSGVWGSRADSVKEQRRIRTRRDVCMLWVEIQVVCSLQSGRYTKASIVVSVAMHVRRARISRSRCVETSRCGQGSFDVPMSLPLLRPRKEFAGLYWTGMVEN